MSEVGNIIEALVIGRALEMGASDAHIEPRGAKVVIRLRIDGILHEVDSFPAALYPAFISEIKQLADLNACEDRLPQTGQFRVAIGGKRYSFRVNTLPTFDGEKISLQLSQLTAKPLTLKQLGFWGVQLAQVADMLRLKRGLIIMTGPDDAGKATTLFTILSLLSGDHVNISTIEDAIAHKIPGANQTATNTHVGLTFATGLSSIVRSDSEIILASRIPDEQSARLLIDATLSGRLVFSTLNATSGGAAINQLAHMNIEPYLIANAVRNIISTRLVRQLCVKCRESYKPAKTELETINKAFGLTKSAYKNLAKLESVAAKERLGIRDTSSSLGASSITRLWRPKGCKACLNTGYAGRIGLYEITTNTPDIERLIMGRADAATIDQHNLRNNPLDMRTDGLVKALRGVSSIEEVLRATEE